MSCHLPPEIIPVILSNLGKEDLLNFRLVNKDWNNECLNILMKSNWKLSLDSETIGNYVEFLRAGSEPTFILPIKLNGKFAESGILTENVTALQSILGSDCIQAYKLTVSETFGDDETGPVDLQAGRNLLNLISIMSDGLRKLNLSRLHVKLTFGQAAEVTRNSDIRLLNLRSYKSHMETPRDGTTVPVVFNHVMMSNPNLEVLDIGLTMSDTGDINEWNIPFPKLKHVRLANMRPSLQLLKKIKESKPPIHRLHLFYCKIDLTAEKEALASILTCISETLEHLELFGQPVPVFVIPTLKKLKSLMWLAGYGVFTFENIEDINFNSDTFPNLEELEIAVRLQPDAERPAFIESGLPTFPKMKSVIIHSFPTNSTWEWNDPSDFV